MFKRYLQNLAVMAVILALAGLVVLFLEGVLPVKWVALGLAGFVLLVVVPLSWAGQESILRGLKKELTETAEAYRVEKRRAESAESFIKSFVRPRHVIENLESLQGAYLDAVAAFKAAVSQGVELLRETPDATAQEVIGNFRKGLQALENKVDIASATLIYAKDSARKAGFTAEGFSTGNIGCKK